MNRTNSQESISRLDALHRTNRAAEALHRYFLRREGAGRVVVALDALGLPPKRLARLLLARMYPKLKHLQGSERQLSELLTILKKAGLL